MPRQPYSVAVPSDEEERLHPLPFWKGRGLGSGLRTLPQGFLSPVRGTERVVKPIVAWLGCGALLTGETER